MNGVKDVHYGWGRLARIALAVLSFGLLFVMVAPSAHAEDDEWQPVFTQMSEVLRELPAQYESGDQEAVQQTIRKAYYEIYQVSGLEAQINHRLGEDRAKTFVNQLLDLRNQARNGVDKAEFSASVEAVIALLDKDITELRTTPELHDQWTRVANSIIEELNVAKKAYEAGDGAKAATAAKDAYLGHYEAQGLEKASISYLGQSRVSVLEGLFTDLRQQARDQSVTVAEYNATADQLISYIAEDGKQLDELTSRSELGWSGFGASFLILLREGAEALLVVAAVVTYALKANRRDQLKGIGVGVIAAILMSIGLAVLFSQIASSAQAGFSQELLEGITGALAVVMLIWVTNWILTKTVEGRWERYLEETAGKKTLTGGAFALASVAFLAVLREGFETILFYAPILANAKTGGDYAKIWLGLGVAVAILAVMFIAVWKFGVRLPLKKFFAYTSALLGILAITIAGGAIKEFQDATIIDVHRVAGVPEISWLGIYPTVETLAGQLLIVIVLVGLGIRSRQVSTQSVAKATASPAPAGEHREEQ